MKVKDNDVAKVIRRSRRYADAYERTEYVVTGIADLAEQDNPLFDRQRFENETRGETA